MEEKALKHIDDTALCIRRKKRNKKFQYVNEDAKPVENTKLLKRIEKLAIPPMWNDVMICKFDNGHIQATGRDNKGRKQYIYHSLWEKRRQEEKFNRMLEFAEVLPGVRKVCHHHLNEKQWTKEKVTALIVLILDEYGIRIGNKYYTQKNGTFGLTTLRRKHLNFEDADISFEFKGKSGQQREVLITNSDLVPHIKRCAEMTGYEIFRYKDSSGDFHSVDSEMVNDFIHAITQSDFSSKDFRTWAASRLAIEFYPAAKKRYVGNGRRKLSNTLLKMVASFLGNTPSVCRNYYVHPNIFRAVESNKIPYPNPFQDSDDPNDLSASEQLVVQILKHDK